MRILTALGVVEPSTGDVIVNTEFASVIVSVVFASRSVVPSNIICVPTFAYNLVVCITVGAILDTEELLDEPIVGAAELLDEPIGDTKGADELDEPIRDTKGADELEEPIVGAVELLDEPIVGAAELLDEPILRAAELLEEPIGDTKGADELDEPILRAAELLEEPIVVGAVMGAAELLDEPIPLNELLDEPNTPGKPELLDEPNGATKAAELLDEPTPNTLVNVIFAIGVPVLLNLAYRLPLLTNPNSSYPK